MLCVRLECICIAGAESHFHSLCHCVMRTTEPLYNKLWTNQKRDLISESSAIEPNSTFRFRNVLLGCG